MDTSTIKPTSPGDGRGDSKPVRPGVSAPLEPGIPDLSPPKTEERSKSKESSLLGANGESIPIGRDFGQEALERGRDWMNEAGKSWNRLSRAAGDAAERNPGRFALTALGVGLVAGSLLGILLAKD